MIYSMLFALISFVFFIESFIKYGLLIILLFVFFIFMNMFNKRDCI